MREIPFTDEFGAVINMFTAFGYFESEDEDVRVLEAVANSLKSGGKLLLDTINREWVLSNYVQNDWHTDADGNTYLEHREFDLVTGRNRVTFNIVTPDGTRRESPGHDVRLYTLDGVGPPARRGGAPFVDRIWGLRRQAVPHRHAPDDSGRNEGRGIGVANSGRYTTSCSIMSAKVSRLRMSLASPSLTITMAGRGFRL